MPEERFLCYSKTMKNLFSSQPSHLNLAQIAQFLQSLKEHDTCVYVASGPQADRCNEFSNVDWIGINNTWQIMQNPPRFMMTQFDRYLRSMDPLRVKWVLCPHVVGNMKEGKGLSDPRDCGFPADQIKVFEIREEKFLDAEKITQKMDQGKMTTMLRYGGIGTYGLIFCALAGYKKIICCGHDGGLGRHPVLHNNDIPKNKYHDENLKRTRELADSLVRHGYSSEIVFAQDL